MDSCERDLLIEIAAPIKGSADHVMIATGFPISRGRILTARHAVFFEERDLEREVEVRWFHQSGPAHQWRTAKLVWDGGSEFDIAVLDCVFPENPQKSRMVSNDPPIDDSRWASEGLPRAGKRDDGSRAAIPMLGNVHGAASGAKVFALGVDHSIDAEENWRGASGSPVFAHGQLIGVITVCPANFKAGRLLAVPTRKLLEIREFREAVGYDDRHVRLAEVLANVATVLARSPEAMDALKMDESYADARIRARILADKLQTTRLDEILGLAETARKALSSTKAQLALG